MSAQNALATGRNGARAANCVAQARRLAPSPSTVKQWVERHATMLKMTFKKSSATHSHAPRQVMAIRHIEADDPSTWCRLLKDGDCPEESLLNGENDCGSSGNDGVKSYKLVRHAQDEA